jgi:hypothetical protein
VLWTNKSLRFSSLFFPVLSAVLLVLNIALILQNRALKAPEVAPASMLPPRGTKVDRIDGLSLDGAPMQVGFGNDHRKTMLYVFSTTCGVCRVNWPNWNALNQTIDNKSFKLMYANINSEISKEYLDSHGLSADKVFAQLDPRSKAAPNLQVTPLTIMLGDDGTIERYWAGALQKEDISEIEKLMSGSRSRWLLGGL